MYSAKDPLPKQRDVRFEAWADVTFVLIQGHANPGVLCMSLKSRTIRTRHGENCNIGLDLESTVIRLLGVKATFIWVKQVAIAYPVYLKGATCRTLYK